MERAFSEGFLTVKFRYKKPWQALSSFLGGDSVNIGVG
jgi:hypothetical protein